MSLTCSSCGAVACDNKINLAVKDHKIPFVCQVCGVFQFKYQAIRDIVFIWPLPSAEKIGNIVLPEICRTETEFGVVLSVGRGVHDKKGRFHPVTFEVGDLVAYDKDVPWRTTLYGSTGIKKFLVKYMGARDIKAVVESGNA